MNEVQKIMVLAAAGGGVDVVGSQSTDGWRFWHHARRDRRFFEDEVEIPHEQIPVSEIVPVQFQSIEDVLATIEWDWNKFSAIEIHPEFRQQIYRIKCLMDEKRGFNKYVDLSWRQACDIRRVITG